MPNVVYLDPHTGHDGQVMTGDLVYVAARVSRRYSDLAEVIIEAWTETTSVTVRTDQIVAVEVPEPGPEPENGTWVPTDNDPSTAGLNVFVRDDDAAGPDRAGDTSRRYQLRWRDVAGGDWVAWPTVIHRGGDPTKALTAHTPTTDRL